MKAITTILLSVIINTILAQEITFSTQKEIEDAVIYLNKLRHSKEFVKQETGIELNKVVGKDVVIDSTLCELAKLRVIEIIETNNFSHKTKYNDDFYSECIAYSWEKDIKSHIRQYIIDEGVPDAGHRVELIRLPNEKVGISTGTINGRTYSVFIFTYKYDEIFIALK
jgi:hypothetical protein